MAFANMMQVGCGCCGGGGGGGGGGGSGTGGGAIIGCCDDMELPGTLQLYSCDPTGAATFGLYRDATLAYGTPPPDVVTSGLLGPTVMAWFSTEAYTDSITGVKFYYGFFGCFALNLYFLGSDGHGGVGTLGAAHQAVCQWGIGGRNTCSPLNLIDSQFIPTGLGGTGSFGGCLTVGVAGPCYAAPDLTTPSSYICNTS